MRRVMPTILCVKDEVPRSTGMWRREARVLRLFVLDEILDGKKRIKITGVPIRQKKVPTIAKSAKLTA